jgi:putative ATP-dependent endonuclease of OLD family
MHVVRVVIDNFRCIRHAGIYPGHHTVLLGPNNTGKTTVLEALNLLLNPEVTPRSHAIDENDFYRRDYQPAAPAGPEGISAELPTIRIEAVLAGLTADDEDAFRDHLVPWQAGAREVVEAVAEGENAFANAVTAIRVAFEAWYDAAEDDFVYDTYFVRALGTPRDERPKFWRDHKRRVGFLIYRDFRALTRPLTLEPITLFARVLQSQDVALRRFEDVLARVEGALDPMTGDPEVAAIINSYKAELERFLLLSAAAPSALSFEITDRTRSQLKAVAQLYVRDEIPLPLQTSGAGTRSIAILAMLTLIMRRRGRGILALEEPETFLFPHAQRRVIDECLDLADQLFVTTHSPYVLERMPVDAVGRVDRRPDGSVAWRLISGPDVKQVNLYSKRLRQVFCEALLGRGVVIVEGDSDRWWLNGASRLLNRKQWGGSRQEAFELQGIAVVSADTNGDIPKLGRFFVDAGLKVAGVADRVTDTGVLDALCGADFPVIFLRQGGLEAVLAQYLPIEIVQRVLLEAPFTKVPVLASAAVAAMTEAQQRARCRDMLEGNKGSAFMHEWMLSLLDEGSLPEPLGRIVATVSDYMAGTRDLWTRSLL